MSATDTYIVYETTNLVNGKYYIGVHKLSSRKNYLGSGTILKLAIKKYSRINFIRKTLKEFSNKQDAYDYERSIVDDNLINNHNCYNIKNGGYGGSHISGENHPLYGTHLPSSTKKKMSVSGKNKIFTDSHRINLSKSMIGKNNHRSKLWFINGKIFYSSTEAGECFNVNKSTIQRWCNNNVPLCYYY